MHFNYIIIEFVRLLLQLNMGREVVHAASAAGYMNIGDGNYLKWLFIQFVLIKKYCTLRHE